MTKSAAEVMHDVIVAAVIDGVAALRAGSKGLPNALLRDINAIHPNTTFQDLPKDVQASIQHNVRAAFTRLQKEGYTVFNPKLAPPPRAQPKPPGDRGAQGPGGPARGPSGPRDTRPSGPREQRRPRPGGGRPQR